MGTSLLNEIVSGEVLKMIQDIVDDDENTFNESDFKQKSKESIEEVENEVLKEIRKHEGKKGLHSKLGLDSDSEEFNNYLRSIKRSRI